MSSSGSSKSSSLPSALLALFFAEEEDDETSTSLADLRRSGSILVLFSDLSKLLLLLLLLLSLLLLLLILLLAPIPAFSSAIGNGKLNRLFSSETLSISEKSREFPIPMAFNSSILRLFWRSAALSWLSVCPDRRDADSNKAAAWSTRGAAGKGRVALGARIACNIPKVVVAWPLVSGWCRQFEQADLRTDRLPSRAPLLLTCEANRAAVATRNNWFCNSGCERIYSHGNLCNLQFSNWLLGNYNIQKQIICNR